MGSIVISITNVLKQVPVFLIIWTGLLKQDPALTGLSANCMKARLSLLSTSSSWYLVENRTLSLSCSDKKNLTANFPEIQCISAVLIHIQS